MRESPRQLVRGFWATSLGTLASRVLGLARDVVTAALLGLGSGGVMDAFVVAFRLPNLARRVFGEGALAASLLPVFASQHHRDPRAAWRLVSVLLALLAGGLAAVVLVGEAILGLLWWSGVGGSSFGELVGLTAVMLPYMILVCLAAQVSTTLQGLLRFRVPALAPLLLNVCWLAAAWYVAPRVSADRITQAYVIAVAIVLSGGLQLAVQLPALRRAGFRWEWGWAEAMPAVRQVGRAMLPVTFGLAVTQINTLLDSLIAVGLARDPAGPRTIAWLGHAVSYPLEQGAAAAIYYGERFYQLPVGVLGLAIATVIYPLLARHAARGDRKSIAADLTLGLRLVWFTALPAGIGIVLLARPMTELLFVRGAFTLADAHRAAAMIACYASAAWAYCALPVLVRGFYASGDRATPTRIGLGAVVLNLALTALLIWPLAERGLAVSTAVAASMQVVLLVGIFSRTDCGLDWPALRAALAKGSLATAAMAGVVVGVQFYLPAAVAHDNFERALRLTLSIGTGVFCYAGVAWLLGMPELGLLLRRGEPAVGGEMAGQAAAR